MSLLRDAQRTRHLARPVVLITGFGPFPGMPVNASAPFVRDLARRARLELPDIQFVSRILPTEWRRAPQTVALLHKRYLPAVALHFGVAAQAIGIRLETRAANACRPNLDAAGQSPADEKLGIGGPAFRNSNLPTTTIAAHLNNLGYHADISHDAGAYICNAVYFQSLACVETSNCNVGFVHIPSVLPPSSAARRKAASGAVEIIKCALAELSPPQA